MERVSATTRSPGLSRSQIVAVSLLTMAAVLPNVSIAPALPDIQVAFGLSDSAIVVLLMTAHGPGIVLTSVHGVLADRLGRREVAVPALVVYGVGGLAAMMAPNYPLLIVFRLVQGCGSAGFLTLAITILSDHYDGVERTRRLGRNALALTMGVALFPAIGGGLTELFGWRGPFALSGATLVLAVALWRLLPPGGGDGGARTLAAQLADARVDLARPQVWGLLVLGTCTLMVFFGSFVSTLPLHLEDRFGASAGVRGLILSAPALTSGFTAWRLGTLAERHPTSRLARTGFLALGSTLALVAVAPSLAVVWIPVLFLGIGEALTIIPFQSRIAGLAHEERRAAVVAAWGTAVRIGQVSAPLVVAGLLLVGSTQMVLLVAAGWCLVLFGAVWLLRPVLDD